MKDLFVGLENGNQDLKKSLDFFFLNFNDIFNK